jgi:glycosyltransferase involved in cell wall biosynthesis
VITALAKLREGGEAGTLDIIGGGSPKAVKAIERVIARHRASHYVRLLGEKIRTEIDCLLPEYCAMVLPSFPESFGLVYLEALTAGVPVMTARNAGFDGYFESAFPGVIVAHDNVTEIMEGLQTLSRDAGLLRSRIGRRSRRGSSPRRRSSRSASRRRSASGPFCPTCASRGRWATTSRSRSG